MQERLTLATFAGALLGAAVAAAAPGAGTAQTFRATRTLESVDQVQVALQVSGDLKTVDQGQVERMKMSVAADFVYDEKLLHAPGPGDGPTRSIRYYHRASGAIQSGEHEYKPVLRDDRRLIAVEVDGPQVTLHSPQGPLSFDELELTDVLANSLLLDRLLPQKPVAAGAQWEHSDDLVASLLGLDAIDKNEVISTLSEVAEGKARFAISGRVSGFEVGVSTEIELKGKYHFDLNSQRITWFGILVRESRAVGHVDTGFDVVARLQMRITPDRRSQQLTGEALKQFELEPTREATQLSYEVPGGEWRLTHDRRWSVISEEEDQAVLRLIDEGDRLAQCNVALLPQEPGATKFTLEAFQHDVVRALDENVKSVIRASQRHNENDYRVFQVVAEGEASEVAMHWVYYLVIDKHGRRVVLAFVLEKEMLSRFDQADQRLVGSLRLAEPRLASKPAGEERSEGSKR